MLLAPAPAVDAVDAAAATPPPGPFAPWAALCTLAGYAAVFGFHLVNVALALLLPWLVAALGAAVVVAAGEARVLASLHLPHSAWARVSPVALQRQRAAVTQGPSSSPLAARVWAVVGFCALSVGAHWLVTHMGWGDAVGAPWRWLVARAAANAAASAGAGSCADTGACNATAPAAVEAGLDIELE